MTIVFSDDFNRSNSATVGNSWTETESGTGLWSIDTNRLKLSDQDASFGPIIQHTFSTSETSYEFEFSFTPGQTDGFLSLMLMEDAKRRIEIRASNDGNWYYMNSVPAPVLLSGGGYSADTEYVHKLIVDETAETFDWWINDVERGTGLSFRDISGTSNCNIISFDSSSAATSVDFWDYVTITDGVGDTANNAVEFGVNF